MASRAAGFLLDAGVATGDVVALQLPKRVSTYALMLGCLRIGAIYAPIDSRNPAARTESMLARIKPALMITATDALNPYGRTIVASSDGNVQMDQWPHLGDEWIAGRQSTPADPAYIMFTSGSTGEPKGAVVPQQGVLSLMDWARDLLGDADQHRFTALNPLHFDNSVFDFYCGLVSGATLLPVEISERPDPSQWIRVVADDKATVMFAVPTLLLLLDQMDLLGRERLPYVRNILFGGEGFPIDRLRRVHQRLTPETRLINVYGPTETSCICSSLIIDEHNLAATTGPFPSLGRMHNDFSHLILDDIGRPVAQGEAGELWIGGPNVGLGYFGNEPETAQRFKQDPRQSEYRAIYYRSGDLVRADLDGRLWFQGRADNQVKIAGHRVELEEIDGAVEAHPGVRRSLTVLVGPSTAPQLMTAFEAETDIAPEILMAGLVARLPAYMRPARIVQLKNLPLNGNGKLDRRALLVMAQGWASENSSGSEEPPQPTTSAATLIRTAWRHALGHSAFTDTASFFDVGGTSLALLRVHAELAAHRPGTLSMIDLFAYPTVESLAGHWERAVPVSSQVAQSIASRGARQQVKLAQMRRRNVGGQL